MEYQKRKYFYIGMTGDRKYESARSPFYRMNGHFSLLESSTQNQIIQGIRKNFPSEKNVERALCEMNFTYYAYMIVPFDKEETSQHHTHRKLAESIESSLIKKMKSEFGEGFVFNKHLSVKNFADGDTYAEELLSNIKYRMKSAVERIA